jgi:hypothetical protein
MRVVTLGSLNAVAAVVPAGAPQYYGLGEAPMSVGETLKSPTFWKGAGYGLLLGGIFGYWLRG